MNRRDAIKAGSLVLAGFGFLADPTRAQDQGPKRSRVSMVSPNMQQSGPRGVAQFWERLRQLGYVDKENMLAERYFADGDASRLQAVLGEVVARKPDVIVTWTTPAAVMARKATATIPIVVVTMNEPVRLGLAASFSRPGGNVTGNSLAYTEGLAGKWLQMLADIVPQLSTVAVIYHPGSQSNWILLENANAAAPRLNVRLKPIEVSQVQNLAPAVREARSAQAALVLPDPFTGSHRATITDLMAKHRLPAVYGLVEFVDAGGLIAYGVDHVPLFNRAAECVDRILKGANPGDLPIEQPTAYLTAVNLKVAKALGITIPESVLLRADEVIR